jgi:hypothetical protein
MSAKQRFTIPESPKTHPKIETKLDSGIFTFRDEFAVDCPLHRRVGSELDSRQIMTAPAMTPFHIRRITSRLRAVSAVRRALAD